METSPGMELKSNWILAYYLTWGIGSHALALCNARRQHCALGNCDDMVENQSTQARILLEGSAVGLGQLPLFEIMPREQ